MSDPQLVSYRDYYWRGQSTHNSNNGTHSFPLTAALSLLMSKDPVGIKRPLPGVVSSAGIQRPWVTFSRRSPLKIESRRILIVDDSWAWRRAVRSILQKHLDLVIIGECSDGLEAVQKSEELQPDLVLLDIGLPDLNGVEAARQIRKIAPVSRILFLTSYQGPEILHEAMSVGALGLVVKLKASRELLPAIRTVLRDEQFIGTGFSPLDPTKLPHS